MNFRRKLKNPVRQARKIKIGLELDLAQFYRTYTRRTQYLLGEPEEARALAEAAFEASRMRSTLKRLPDDVGADTLRSALQQAGEQIRGGLAIIENPDRRAACQAWAELLALIHGAERRLPAGAPAPSSIAPRIDIASDILLAAHARLFPAERMLVAAGWREGKDIRFSTLFDVTGEASSGHVRADPPSLGQALILMETAGAFLAGWIHSHPGSGRGATQPSSADLNQYHDWQQHYSPHLLCAIVVRDGWIRFWGENVESGLIRAAVIGAGAQQEQDDENLYRLAV